MRKFLCPIVCMISSVQMLTAVAHPRTHLSKSEIIAIRNKLNTGAQPWTAAYDKALQDLEAALPGGPYSVTFQGNVFRGMRSESWAV